MTPKIEIDQPSLMRHIRALNRMKEGDLRAIDEGLLQCAQIVLAKSNYYCPIETGVLKASGKTQVEGKGRWTKATVVYDAPYAVPVHERMDLKHAPPTSAKFLEKGARESKGTMTNIMKRHIEVT